MSLLDRRALLTCLSTALTPALVVAIAAPAQAQMALARSYTAQGMNPDGSKYRGVVRITEEGGVFSVFWTVGSRSYSGVGRLDGRVLTVNWGPEAPVIYVVMPDGTLHGTWASGRALELLVPS